MQLAVNGAGPAGAPVPCREGRGRGLPGTGGGDATRVCPGGRVLEGARLLPMAVPAYIIAYTYTGLLDFAGPVQGALRAIFGWGYGDYWFPNIRSLPGAIVMLSLGL